MQLTETGCLTAQQKQSLLELWNQEYPAQLGYVSMADFEKYLDTLTAAKHWLLIAWGLSLRMYTNVTFLSF